MSRQKEVFIGWIFPLPLKDSPQHLCRPVFWVLDSSTEDPIRFWIIFLTQYQHSPNWILQGGECSCFCVSHRWTPPLFTQTPEPTYSFRLLRTSQPCCNQNDGIKLHPVSFLCFENYSVWICSLFQHLPCQDLFSQTHYWCLWAVKDANML